MSGQLAKVIPIESAKRWRELNAGAIVLRLPDGRRVRLRDWIHDTPKP